MAGRIPRTPARSSGDLAIGTIFDGSCRSFGWDGNCKVEPPLSFDVALYGPLEHVISQINLRGFVPNSPIYEPRQYAGSPIVLFPAIYRRLLDCIANHQRRRIKDR